MRTTSKSQNRAKNSTPESTFPQQSFYRTESEILYSKVAFTSALDILNNVCCWKVTKSAIISYANSKKERCSNVCEKHSDICTLCQKKSIWVPVFLYPHFRLSVRPTCRKYVACLALPLPKQSRSTLKSDWLYSLRPKMEKLYTVKKQHCELTVAQIMSFLLPNSDWNWRK